MGKKIITSIYQLFVMSVNAIFSFALLLLNMNKKNHSSAQFYFFPILLGGLSVAFILFGSDLDVLTISICILLLSILFGWRLHQNHKNILSNHINKYSEENLNTGQFYERVFPIWSKQITTSRGIGDKAVKELTQIFASIVARLDSMLKLSKNNVRKNQEGDGLFETIEKNHVDIQSVFEDLKSALNTVKESKDMILAEVTMYSANMMEMADESKGMAMKSKMIALNAEIEAARAGKAGTAFAAVVSEMRQLANSSSEASDLMAKKVGSINVAMSKFYRDEQAMEELEEQHVTSAETLIRNILERFNEVTIALEESIDTMERESQQIKTDISSSLVSMQFQDRLSQILAHVADDIDAFNQLSESDIKNIDTEAWLNEMKNNFSVEEEYDNFNGGSGPSESPNLLTFF